MELVKGQQPKAFKLVVYGPPGVGKSTLATYAPGAIFIDIEDALHRIDCVKTKPVVADYNTFVSWLRQLCQMPECQTIVIDTGDALEDLMVKKICLDHNKKSIGDFGFGKGYELLNSLWLEVIEMLDYINRVSMKNIIIVSHSIIKRYEDPMHEGYDRICLKMHQKSAATLITRADAVCYYDFEKIVNQNDKGVNKAIGTGRRLLYCNEKPAFVAKNRYSLPDKVEPQGFFDLLK